MLLNKPFVIDSRPLKQARSLAENGYKVTLYAVYDINPRIMSFTGAEGKELPDYELKDNITVKRVMCSMFPYFPENSLYLKKYLSQYKFFLELLDREDFDVIHCFDSDMGLIGYLSAKQKRTKFVYDSTEYWMTYGNAIAEAEKILMANADGIIALSEHHAGEMIKHYTLNGQLIILHNVPHYRKPDPQKSLKKLLNTDKKIILFLGIMFGGRGLERLVPASRDLKDAIVVLMGVGPLKDKLKEQIKELQLEDKVKVLEPVPYDEVVDYASSADVGINIIENLMLNNYYCLPNKFFEYIVSGIPVAVSNFPVMRGIIDKYNIGTTFNPEDINDVINKLNCLLSNQEMYSQIKANVQYVGEHIFNWQNDEKKLLQLYSSLS